jgi:hypothetical protein
MLSSFGVIAHPHLTVECLNCDRIINYEPDLLKHVREQFPIELQVPYDDLGLSLLQVVCHKLYHFR